MSPEGGLPAATLLASLLHRFVSLLGDFEANSCLKGHAAPSSGSLPGPRRPAKGLSDLVTKVPARF